MGIGSASIRYRSKSSRICNFHYKICQTILENTKEVHKKSSLFLQFYFVYVVYTFLPKHSTLQPEHPLPPHPPASISSSTHSETYTDNVRDSRGQIDFVLVSISCKESHAYTLPTCISPAGPAGAVGSCEGLVVGLLHQVGSTVQVSQRTLKYIL